MDDQPTSNRKLKKYLITGLAVIALVALLYWFYGISYISIAVSNPSGGSKYQVTITNQVSGDRNQFESNETVIKKRVKRGSYVVSVQQSNRSYLATTSSPGFFRSTDVAASLVQEKSRRFVGDNPGACTYYIGHVLYSSGCTDLFSNIDKHVPATSRQPTYTLKNKNLSNIEGYVQGVVSVGGGNVALIQTAQDSEAGGTYSLIQLSGELGALQQRTADQLDINKTYEIVTYKTGFLVYSQGLDSAYYYGAFGTQPKTLHLETATDPDLAPSFLEVRDNSILAAYTSQDDAKSSVAKTELIISGNGVTHYSFKKKFTSATICAASTLCAVDGGGLSVYRLNGDSAKVMYQIPKVASVYSSNNRTLVTNSEGVINLDVRSGSGYFEYSFGGYRFNNIAFVADNYILSVSDPKNKVSALYIDSSQPDIDSIDKRILPLKDLDIVSAVSVYGNYIYIAPYLGDPIYNEQTGNYDFDSSTIADANRAINNALAKSGIDTKTYTITNTSQ